MTRMQNDSQENTIMDTKSNAKTKRKAKEEMVRLY